ncbi:hypothetical protein [Mesorhizobium sp. BE184]|uniref:hypothetical protein n=1 Tax=Mesorhizobium sp. BE184 TaxID=2817714 RepID=UPI002862E126|nr:hypothetical protein [Mesorhizobium sp. BE184]MDR7032445.1 hypothetical protein [Mesorhizobium sp. BE184]
MSDRQYPFSVDTLGKMKEMGSTLSINCHVCNKHSMLDMDKLIERFGADHSCMAPALRPHFYCRDCQSAGRKDRDFTFIHHTSGGHNIRSNAYAKAKGV